MVLDLFFKEGKMMRREDTIVEACGRVVLLTVAITAGVVIGDLICQLIEYWQSMLARDYDYEDDDWHDFDEEFAE